MYEIDKEKRYNITYILVGSGFYYLKNVSLKVVERNFVVAIDKNGKEHILTGTVGIQIDEI